MKAWRGGPGSMYRRVAVDRCPNCQGRYGPKRGLWAAKDVKEAFFGMKAWRGGPGSIHRRVAVDRPGRRDQKECR